MYKFLTSILSFTPTNCGSPPPPRRYGTPSPPAPPSLPCVFSVGNTDIITGFVTENGVLCKDGSIINLPMECLGEWDMVGDFVRFYGIYDRETSSMITCIASPFSYDSDYVR